MTNKHSDRANGDSYFTVEELDEIKIFLDFCARRSNKETCDKIGQYRKKLNQEIEYIKSINVSK